MGGGIMLLRLEIFRYGLASLLALGVDVAWGWVLFWWMGVNLQIAAAVGFCAGMVVVYIFSFKFVFNNRRMKEKGKEFLVFCGIGLLGLILNGAVLHVAVVGIQQSFLVGKVVAAGIVFIFNFSLRKALLFSKGAQ